MALRILVAAMVQQSAFFFALMQTTLAINTLQQTCTTILSGVASSGSTETEIAAACRASYPLQMCRDMRTSLGSLPWPGHRIHEACANWLQRAESSGAKRNMMDFSDLQGTLDECA